MVKWKAAQITGRHVQSLVCPTQIAEQLAQAFLICNTCSTCIETFGDSFRIEDTVCICVCVRVRVRVRVCVWRGGQG